MHSTQKVGRKKKLARCFEKWKLYFSPQKKTKKKEKKNDRIFSLALNIVYRLLKSHCFEFFGGGKYGLFWAKTLIEIWYLLINEKLLFWNFREREIPAVLRQKVYENMIFTDYWNVLGDEKYGIFWCKKLMERWYLLVTEKFLFWAFPWWKMRSSLRQKVHGKMIFTDYLKALVLGYQKVLVLSFLVMGNTVFFSAKKLI